MNSVKINLLVMTFTVYSFFWDNLYSLQYTPCASSAIIQQSWASIHIAAPKRAPKPKTPAQTRPIWICGELPLAGTSSSDGPGAGDISDAGGGDISDSGGGGISDEGEDEGALVTGADEGVAPDDGVSDEDGGGGDFVTGAGDGDFAFAEDGEEADGEDDGVDCSIPGAMIGLAIWRIETLFGWEATVLTNSTLIGAPLTAEPKAISPSPIKPTLMNPNLLLAELVVW